MDLDLVTLAGRLAGGRVSTSQAIEACLQRIERFDQGINAVRQLDVDGVRRQARSCDLRHRRLGPLDGIPVVVKDNIDIAGLVSRSGLGPRHEQPAARDAGIVAELRAAGALILGHAAMHEGALGATTDNPHYGRTHNPWRLGHTPGGSSGGSAAAVAARLCPLALGTDTMGSVRLPAAYCGLVGFKPSHGLLGNDGIEPLCRRLDQVGPMTRTVGDLRLFFKTLNVLPASSLATVDFGRLRFGRLVEFDEVELSDDVRRAFENGVHRLSQADVTLLDVSIPGFQPNKVRRSGLLVSETEAAASFAADRERFPEAFSSDFAALLDYGASADREKLGEAEQRIDDARKGFDELFDTIDLLVTPTAPQSAFSFDDEVPSNQADFTALANMASAPAISLPIPSADLPVGLQLIGRRGNDALVLSVAELMEQDLCFKGDDLLLDDIA